MPQRIICWDFDHTLFGYQRAAANHANTPQSGEFAGFAPRDGIEPVLERLAQLGFASDITTAGSIKYVRRALAATGATGLLRNVTRIFPADEISFGGGKLYQPVVRFHGLTPEAASARMLIIGDLPDDEPADLAGVVFIRQPNGHLHDPRTIEAVIGMLHEAGEGHFSRGFQVIYATAKQRDQRIPYGGLLAMTLHTTAICIDEQPPRPQRAARLGALLTPTITLLELC